MRGAAVLLGLVIAWPAAAACPDVPTVARFARALLERQVPEPFPGLSPDDARCAQERLVAVLAQPWGDVSGIALAAEALPALRGSLFFANLRAGSGTAIEARFGARPAVAPGLLVGIGADGGIETARPYLALLDLAAMPSGMDAAQRIAGNLGLRLGVQGPETPVTDPAALGAEAMLQADGSVLAASMGLAAAPAVVLAGLARDMAAEGRPLRPGEQVALLGAPIPVPPRPGETWRLAVNGLGAVTVAFR